MRSSGTGFLGVPVIAESTTSIPAMTTAAPTVTERAGGCYWLEFHPITPSNHPDNNEQCPNPGPEDFPGSDLTLFLGSCDLPEHLPCKYNCSVACRGCEHETYRCRNTIVCKQNSWFTLHGVYVEEPDDCGEELPAKEMCQPDYKALDGGCIPCPPGYGTRSERDASKGDYECFLLYCGGEYAFVQNHECKTCPEGKLSDSLQYPAGSDTECYDELPTIETSDTDLLAAIQSPEDFPDCFKPDTAFVVFPVKQTEGFEHNYFENQHNTAIECQRTCQGEDRCHGFTFDILRRVCVLLSQNSEEIWVRENSGTVSGLKFCGVNCGGQSRAPNCDACHQIYGICTYPECKFQNIPIENEFQIECRSASLVRGQLSDEQNQEISEAEIFSDDVNCGKHTANTCAQCTQDLLINVAPQYCTADCLWTSRDNRKELGACRPITAFPDVNRDDFIAREESLCGSEQLVGDAASYNGCAHSTTTGKPCIPWSNFPGFEHGFESDRNYCRNFGGMHHTIWCFTSLDTFEWEFCRPLTNTLHALARYVPEEQMINSIDYDPINDVNCGTAMHVKTCGDCIAPLKWAGDWHVTAIGHSWCMGDCDFWHGECRDACHLYSADVCKQLIESKEREDCILVEEKFCVQKTGVVQEGEGVSCGGHRAATCIQCPDEATYHSKRLFCRGECRWIPSQFDFPFSGICVPDGQHRLTGAFSHLGNLPKTMRPEVVAGFQKIRDLIFNAQTQQAVSTTTIGSKTSSSQTRTTTTTGVTTTTSIVIPLAETVRPEYDFDDPRESSEMKQAVEALREAVWSHGECHSLAHVKKVLEENDAFLQTDEAHTVPWGEYTNEADIPLLLAASQGCDGAIRALLETKPHLVNLVDRLNNTAMIYAAVGDHIEVARVLLEFRASITMANFLNRTAIMFAAKNNNLDMVALLGDTQRAVLNLAAEELGSDLQDQHRIYKTGWDRFINARDIDGQNALSLNMKTILFERGMLGAHVAELLVNDFKIDVMQEIRTGVRPQDIAIHQRDLPFLEIILGSETYDFNAIDASRPDQPTALLSTAWIGWNEGLELVLGQDPGPNVDETYHWGFTALIICAKTGNAKGVEMLIRAGADYNKKNELGMTALFWAIQSGTKATETVRAICENAGSDLDVFAVNKNGHTALSEILATQNDTTIDEQVRADTFEEVMKCARARNNWITDFSLEEGTDDCFAFHQLFPTGEHVEISSHRLTWLDTAEKCQLLCKKTSDCAFFKFVSAESASSAGAGGNECHLLEEITTMKPMIPGPGIITGPKYCTNTYDVCDAPSHGQRFILRARVARKNEVEDYVPGPEFCLSYSQDPIVKTKLYLEHCNYHRNSTSWLMPSIITSHPSLDGGNTVTDFWMEFPTTTPSRKYLVFKSPLVENYNYVSATATKFGTFWRLNGTLISTMPHHGGPISAYLSSYYNTIQETAVIVGWDTTYYDETSVLQWDVLCEAEQLQCDSDLMPRGSYEPTPDQVKGYEWCCMHEGKHCDEEAEVEDQTPPLLEPMPDYEDPIDESPNCGDVDDQSACESEFLHQYRGRTVSKCGQSGFFLSTAMTYCRGTCGLCPGPQCENELQGTEARESALDGRTCEEFFGIHGERCNKVHDHISLAYEHCRKHCKFCEKQTLCYCEYGEPISDEDCMTAEDEHRCASCHEGFTLVSGVCNFIQSL